MVSDHFRLFVFTIDLGDERVQQELEQLRLKLLADRVLAVTVRVQPSARESGLAAIQEDGAFRVRVKSAPERGKANDEVRDVIAALFGVVSSQVEIRSGESSRTKHIRIRLPNN